MKIEKQKDLFPKTREHEENRTISNLVNKIAQIIHKELRKKITNQLPPEK